MARKKKKVGKPKSDGNSLSPELLDKIRVTDEDREQALSGLKYTITPKPEGMKKPKGKLYCPYCAKFTKFANKRNTPFNYKRCYECNISEEDFHVKTHNDMWNMGKKK